MGWFFRILSACVPNVLSFFLFFFLEWWMSREKDLKRESVRKVLTILHTQNLNKLFDYQVCAHGTPFFCHKGVFFTVLVVSWPFVSICSFTSFLSSWFFFWIPDFATVLRHSSTSEEHVKNTKTPGKFEWSLSKLTSIFPKQSVFLMVFPLFLVQDKHLIHWHLWPPPTFHPWGSRLKSSGAGGSGDKAPRLPSTPAHH